MSASFIGFVSLPFIPHGDLTTISALLTGVGCITSWQYYLALGLGADFCGRGGIVILCEWRHLREKLSRFGTLCTITFCLSKSRDLGI